jgi:hypothetical protein
MGKVAWYRERGREEPTVEETPSGLEGMLLVTSLIGAGSTYLNYRIGDKAQATGKGYRGITRSEVGNIAGSCAADALAI